MPTCPNGHQSAADDWCEVCGHQMPASEGAGGPPGGIPGPPGPPQPGYGFPQQPPGGPGGAPPPQPPPPSQGGAPGQPGGPRRAGVRFPAARPGRRTRTTAAGTSGTARRRPEPRRLRLPPPAASRRAGIRLPAARPRRRTRPDPRRQAPGYPAPGPRTARSRADSPADPPATATHSKPHPPRHRLHRAALPSSRGSRRPGYGFPPPGQGGAPGQAPGGYGFPHQQPPGGPGYGFPPPGQGGATRPDPRRTGTRIPRSRSTPNGQEQARTARRTLRLRLPTASRTRPGTACTGRRSRAAGAAGPRVRFPATGSGRRTRPGSRRLRLPPPAASRRPATGRRSPACPARFRSRVPPAARHRGVRAAPGWRSWPPTRSTSRP